MSNMWLPPRRPVGVPTPLPAGCPVTLGRNVYPQKHDQDRIHPTTDTMSEAQPRLSSTACSLMANSPWGRNARSLPPACHRTDGQVLGTNLNCSESRAAPRCETCLTARKSHWRPKDRKSTRLNSSHLGTS